MPYPALVNTVADCCFWQPMIQGPFRPTTGGDNRYAITAQNTGTASLRRLRAWKSTDRGLTWAEMDSANRPVIHNARSGRNFCPIQDGDNIRVAFSFTGPELQIATFSMASDTWAATITGGPTPVVAQGFSDDGGDYRVHMVKRSTDASYWLLYMGTSDLVGGNQKDRCWLVEYDGSWQSPTKVFGTAGEDLDYVPSGLIEGSNGRLHMWATSNNSAATSYILYHRALDSGGSLQSLQTVVSDVHPIREPHVSQAILDGSSRVWVGFARAGSGVGASQKWTPAVVYGASADTPSWIEENINATEITNLGGFNFAHVGSIATTVFGVWRDGPNFYYSTNVNLAGWSAPITWGDSGNSEIYSQVRGLSGVGLGLFAAPNLQEVFYTEIDVDVEEPVVIVEPLDVGCLYFSA